MAGRAIRIFLADGTPSGLRTAEIGVPTVKGVIAPRVLLGAFGQRQENRRTGVYVLVGDDPQVPGRLAIYSGEGDDVCRRLIEHDRDTNKDFFDRVATFVSKDLNLMNGDLRLHIERESPRKLSAQHKIGKKDSVSSFLLDPCG